MEVVFAFRLLFKLFDANRSNGFVKGLYAVTQPIVGIFEGIFSKPTASGSVLEPSTLIVLVVVGLLAWGVLKIMGETSRSTEKTQVQENDPSTQPLEKRGLCCKNFYCPGTSHSNFLRIPAM